MTQCRMVALPIELLDKICSYLCWHCEAGGDATAVRPDTNDTQGVSTISAREGHEALLSLSRTCTVLYIAAQPFLYHRPYTTNCRDLYLFVRTLSERPDLASKVTKVDVGHVSVVPTTADDGSSSLNSGEVKCHHSCCVCQANVRGAPIPDPGRAVEEPVPEIRLEDFGEVREPAGYEGLASLLLQLTPRLAQAQFHIPSYASFEPFAQSHASSSQLKTLAITSPDHVIMPDQAVMMRRPLANLRVLQCHECAELIEQLPVPSGLWRLDDQAPLQSLVELSLINISLTISSLRNFLKGVGPKLTIVNIQPRLRKDATAKSDRVRFGDALDALQPWNQTIKELTLGKNGWQYTFYTRDIDLLRKFRTLEILNVETYFFGAFKSPNALTSTIPPSLRELRLRSSCGTTSALQNFLEAYLAGKYPRLTRIELDYHYFDEGSALQRELREINATFLSVGMNFIINPRRPGT